VSFDRSERSCDAAWIGVLLAAGSGVLYSLAFPPTGLWVLGWIALAPLYLAVLRQPPFRAFLLGIVWCLCAGWGVGGFLPETLSHFFGASGRTGWLGFFGVMALIAPLYGAYASWLAWLASRQRASPWLAAAGFGLCEFARSQLGSVGAWALLAYSQVPNLHVIQVLDLIGAYGLGMLMAASSFLLAACFGSEIRVRPVALRALAMLAILVAVLGYGQWRVGQSFGTGESASVALVQSGLEREQRRDPERRAANFIHQIELTSSVSATRPEIIVWPEHAVEFYLREDSAQRRLLFERSSQWGADLVIGGPHYRSRHSPPRYHNSAFLIRDGRFGGRYDKRELLPFAESNLLPEWFPRDVHYTPGDRLQPLQARVPIGTFLCSEVLDPSVARGLSRAGAHVLVNPASDDWFTSAGPARILLHTAVARAVENRRYLLRTAQVGHSAIIDPHGRIRQVAPDGRAAVVVGEIFGSKEVTGYQRLGDLPVWLALVSVPMTTLRVRGSMKTSRGERS
jgi:apolipoprotein N-acyltransferase